MEEVLIFDETMVNALAGVGNRTNRVGTKHDVNTNIVLNQVGRLSPDDCYNLIENNEILKEVVTAYPTDGLRLEPEFSVTDTGIESGDIDEYFKNLVFIDIADQQFKGKDAIKEAQIIANIEGNAYLWIDLDDGLEPSEPVDVNRIRSVLGGSLFGQKNISYNPLIIQQGQVVEGGYYTVSTNSGDVVKVHRDRVIPFYGNYIGGDRLKKLAYRCPSRLQSLYDKFAKMEMTSTAIYNYLQTASLFSYKMKDLATLAMQKKTTDLQKRFSTFLQMVSSLGGFVLDADREEINFVNRNFGGLEPLLEKATDQFLAAAGIPKGRLFKGSNTGAMSEAGRSDREQWAALVGKYQSDILEGKIARLIDLCLAAQDGPTRGQVIPYSIIFPSILVDTSEERAKTYETYSKADKAYFEMGLDGRTIIESRFAGTQFGTTITLGENYMKEDSTPEPIVQVDEVLQDSTAKIEIDPYDMPLTSADYENILGLLMTEVDAETIAE